MKNKTLTPLDQAIFSLASEFAKIPDYEKMMKDDDLKKLHTFIAVGIMGIHGTSNMVIGSFIPAANKYQLQFQRRLLQSFRNLQHHFRAVTPE